MKSLKALLMMIFLVGSVAHATVTERYRITFQGDYGISANSVKKDVIEQMPSIFGRYVTDVDWKIIRNSKNSFVVQLTGSSKNRIQGWLYTLQAETQDAVAGVEQVK